MTHGTDRDTPTGEAADREVVDVPDRSGTGDVPATERAADDATADDVTADDATADDATADDATPDDATADDATADDATADETQPATAVDAGAPEQAVEPSRPLPPADVAASEQPSPAAPARAADVAAARPVAASQSEPMAAWPSWDDVAVTAPAAPVAEQPADEPPADEQPADEQPADEQPAAADPTAADPTDQEPDAADPTDEQPSDAPVDAPPAGGGLGGLSALAFTALNAASVGVAAHALPKSPLSDTERPDPAGPAPDAPTSADPTSQAPSTDVPTAAASAPARPASDATQVLGTPDGTAAVPPSAAPEAGDDATRAVPVAGTVPVVAAASTWPATAHGGTGARPAPGGPVERTPQAEREESPLDVFEPEDGSRRWPRVLAITGGAVLLVLAAYVGASYALADRVPRGASVAGVEIGAMSSGEAEQVLADGLADRTTSPVPVVAQDVQAELDPVGAGLVLDVDATVARLTGVDLAQPVRLWRHVIGVGAQRPVTQVDDDALDAALGQLAGSLTLAPVDGTVVFADGAAHATDAVDGWELDVAAAGTVLEDGWLTEVRPVVLPTEVLVPAVTQEETERALAELATPLTAAPVTVQVEDRQAVLDVATLTAHAALVPVDGALELQLDGAALTDVVLGQVPDLLTTASDARFEFQDGAPVIVPGVAGTTLDPTTLAAAVAQAATGEGNRVAPVALVQSDPAETTAALEALGVREIVSEFSTPLTSEPRRTSNIAAGLANISGTLVRPGETFSLTEALGPIDAAHGFVQAGAIVNGEHKDAWGGGLSQVSTTAFNAGYFAGFEDVDHTPHSEWFQRYPEGREATIFTGVIDMKWKNNTPYGALVQGFVADGRAYVRIWSTKHFTVETEKSGRSGVVAPTTVYSQSPTCETQSAGNPGFTVTNTRRVFLNGELVDTESDTWRYKPQNKVVCGTAPAPDAPATP